MLAGGWQWRGNHLAADAILRRWSGVNRSPQLVAMVIWGALLSAIFIYWGIAATSMGGNGDSSKPDASLAETLAIAAAAASGASLMMRQVFFSGFRKGTLSLESPEGQQRFLTGNIICFALSESIGIFGLVLALGGHPQEDWLVFFAAAVVLMLIHIPLPGRFQAKARP